jgi:hypothetical protein
LAAATSAHPAPANRKSIAVESVNVDQPTVAPASTPGSFSAVVKAAGSTVPMIHAARQTSRRDTGRYGTTGVASQPRIESGPIT